MRFSYLFGDYKIRVGTDVLRRATEIPGLRPQRSLLLVRTRYLLVTGPPETTVSVTTHLLGR